MVEYKDEVDDGMPPKGKWSNVLTVAIICVFFFILFVVQILIMSNGYAQLQGEVLRLNATALKGVQMYNYYQNISYSNCSFVNYTFYNDTYVFNNFTVYNNTYYNNYTIFNDSYTFYNDSSYYFYNDTTNNFYNNTYVNYSVFQLQNDTSPIA